MRYTPWEIKCRAAILALCAAINLCRIIGVDVRQLLDAVDRELDPIAPASVNRGQPRVASGAGHFHPQTQRAGGPQGE